jgi:hypothetical protein
VLDISSAIELSGGADDADTKQFARNPGERWIDARILAVGIQSETLVSFGHQHLRNLRVRQTPGRDEGSLRLLNDRR